MKLSEFKQRLSQHTYHISKVIDSCKNQDQIDVVINWADQVADTWIFWKKKKMNIFQRRKADKFMEMVVDQIAAQFKDKQEDTPKSSIGFY